MKREEAKKYFMAKVQEVYDKLKEFFEAGEFSKMGELMGNSTILFSPKGERLQGKDCLTLFWERERKRARTVDFRLEYIYTREAQEPEDRGEKTIEHFAHIITEFHLISSEKNHTGSFSNNLLHLRPCILEP